MAKTTPCKKTCKPAGEKHAAKDALYAIEEHSLFRISGERA
jgi:hypothetical protein